MQGPGQNYPLSLRGCPRRGWRLRWVSVDAMLRGDRLSVNQGGAERAELVRVRLEHPKVLGAHDPEAALFGAHECGGRPAHVHRPVFSSGHAASGAADVRVRLSITFVLPRQHHGREVGPSLLQSFRSLRGLPGFGKVTIEAYFRHFGGRFRCCCQRPIQLRHYLGATGKLPRSKPLTPREAGFSM